MSDYEIKVALISNVLFEPYLQFYIEHVFQKICKSIHLTTIAYDKSNMNIKQEICDMDIIVVALNFEEFSQNLFNDIYLKNATRNDIKNHIIVKCEQLYSFLKKNTFASIVWLGFEDYCYKIDNVVGSISVEDGLIDSINLDLIKLISDLNVFIDLKRLIAKIGANKAYNLKNKYRWNAPYSKELIETVVKEIHKQYLIAKGITKKCLVLDCDNVLWGGILSEDGIENLKLGSSGLGKLYQDFQRFVLSMYYHGVILAICSKNDLSDVLTMFRNHSEMILKEEHIACFQVNWEDKPNNIKKLQKS